MKGGHNTSVDIVVIGRNEGDLLRTALKSCRAASHEMKMAGSPESRIIYVDSYSTDGSLDIARTLGAECFTVEGTPNPAAGRHMGFMHCHSEYVFFVDGDMEIRPRWLPAAIEYLEEHPEVAGVAGICDWEVEEGGKVVVIPNHNNIRRGVQKVTTDVGGGFIYRASVLDQVGDFDPTMTRSGEFELYLRIIAAGYHLVYLAIPMAIHRDRKGSMGSAFLRKSIFTKNIFIPGVIARKAPRLRSTLEILIKRYWLFLWHPISLALVIVFGRWAYVSKGPLSTIIFTIAVLQLVVSHWLYKSRDWKRAAISILTVNIYILAFIIGFIVQWPNVGGFYSYINYRR
jgi:glycosyltransferase involved in cell wall biosynthesis